MTAGQNSSRAAAALRGHRNTERAQPDTPDSGEHDDDCAVEWDADAAYELGEFDNEDDDGDGDE